MKKSLTAACVALALTVPGYSFAQFGNLLSSGSKLLGGGATGTSGASADMPGQQDHLVRNYMAAGKDVLTANDNMAHALNIQTQAVDAAATSNSISASDIEAQDKAISANAQAVADAAKNGATLKDSQAKAQYAKGLVSLVSGMRKYVGMRADVQNFSSGLTGVSPLQIGGLQSGMYVAKSLPSSLSNLSSVLKGAIDFARSNGVEVPADATSLL